MLYDGDTFEDHGRTFVFRSEWDTDMGPPWKEHDGHGIVSEWTTRDKEPGERVLATDRGYPHFYDFTKTMKVARRDGWGLCDADKAKLTIKLGHEPKRGDITAEAVERDFDRLRRWCNDQWQWIGIIVRDEETGDEETGDEESLWGIESDAGDYLDEVAHELASQIRPLAEASADA